MKSLIKLLTILSCFLLFSSAYTPVDEETPSIYDWSENHKQTPDFVRSLDLNIESQDEETTTPSDFQQKANETYSSRRWRY